MVRLPPWQRLFIVIVILAGLIYAAPNVLSSSTREMLPSWWPTETVNLGLDLQGGSHLLLEVELNKVLTEHLQSFATTAEQRLRDEGLKVGAVTIGEEEVHYRLTSEDLPRAREILQDEFGDDVSLSVNEAASTLKMTLSEAFRKDRRQYALAQSIEIVRRRIDETGTKEPLIQRQGQQRIVVQLPGLDDPGRIKDLLGQTAQLSFHLVDTELTGQLGPQTRIPVTRKRVPAAQDEQRSTGLESYVLHRRAIITGDMLVDANPTFQRGQPVVSFRLDSRGSERFFNVTRDNVGRPFAIVLDGEVISAPRINGPIPGGQAVITGSFTTQEVQDLALLLRAGALPAPLQILEERSVGPGLGADSIEAGKEASIIGLIAVMVFAVLAYGLFGVMAVIALVINLILILAVLSALQATLTLPGIAGIVLTIGMAVDANVLIFERIREELNQGRSVIAAIDSGYQNALSSIVDANVTTFIAAVLLYIFGTGPVRGFAVTLSIGLVTSFFSAVMLTRWLVTGWLWRAKPETVKV